MTLKEQLTQYNCLVVYAHMLGINAKLHTSQFESIAKGKIQLDKLRQKVLEKWFADGFMPTAMPIPQRAAP